MAEPKEQSGWRAQTDLFGHGQALWVGDGGELLLLQLVYGVLIVPQIQLSAHQDEGGARTVVPDLWVPLQRPGESRHQTANAAQAEG